MARRQHGWMLVQIEHEGRTITADYSIISRGRAVNVATLRSCRSMQCDGLPPEYAAQRLLRTMADEGMA